VLTSTHDPQVIPSILNSHFSDKGASLALTNGSLSPKGRTTLPKDADNGVLAKMFVNTADIADMISQYY
jgi:hypothetical protein